MTIEPVDNLDSFGTIFNSKKWLDLVGAPYRLWGIYKGKELVGGVVDCDTIGVKLTPYHGIVLKDKIYEYSVVKAVAEMPNLKLVNHYSITDARPFLWKDYKPILRYTYITNRHHTFEKDTRYEIGKAINNNLVVSDGTISQFWTIYKETFERKFMTMPVNYDWFKRFDEAVKPKIYIIDNLAGAVIMSDTHRDYYIFGASSQDAQNTGASSLVLSHAILCSDEMDLVGCNNKSIGLFKRGFARELKVCIGIEPPS